MPSRLKSWISIAAFGLLLVLAAAAATSATQQSQSLPERLSDAEFWRATQDISEPGGYFRIEDNFTSNEQEVAQVFTLLKQRGVSGGVYMGVGPEQNFTYIAAIRPKMAFIVDIRRQAVMQHLMYKAVFELSKDRGDFISLLFSKPRPSGIDSTTSIQKIWDAYWTVPTDTTAGPRNLTRVVEQLTRTHGFTFTADESAQLKWVFDAFYAHGPSISTRGAPGGRGGGNALTFADLTGYAYDAQGAAQSFLSTEDNYRFVRGLHERNLIVAVSGDFGGPTAIRAVGAWLKQRGGRVSAFYVSNVEQYLFSDGKARAFYSNVGTLPVTDSSVFVRPYALRRGGAALCPIAAFVRAADGGRIYSNNDALACPRAQPAM
jgi:hypothetical protein